MTLAEHVQWARGRAYEYMDDGLAALAIASMLSDLGKDERTQSAVNGCMLAALAVDQRNPVDVRRWIDGCFPSVPVLDSKAVRHG